MNGLATRLDLDEVFDAVTTYWGLERVTVRALPGGMNSWTWSVERCDDQAGRRWVAKLVAAADRDAFERGLAAAITVDAAGIPAGAPEPTRDGGLSVQVAGGCMSLLRWVDGRALTGESAQEQNVVGTTLGAAHLTLRGMITEADRAFPAWIDLDAGHLGVEEWVRPAVRSALTEYAELAVASLTCGVLHGDPAPEAFLWSTTQQRCGLIDWSSAARGPLLYDLATALMYVGGAARASSLLAAYTQTAALTPREISRGLETLLRLRWAVQADYFARRLAVDDRTGIADPAGNLIGLHHARDVLSAPAR